MATILFVSKPIAPPFRDGSKNLVRALSENLSRHDAQVMAPARGGEGAGEGERPVRRLPVYGMGPMGYAPRLRDNLPVLRHLAFERDADLHHYFFAPNPRSGLAARALKALRRKPTVHTLASAPLDDAVFSRALFADVHVALSRHTEARMLSAGIARDRVRCIPAFIHPLSPTGEDPSAIRRRLGLPATGALVTFPGDLEHGGGAELLVRALVELGSQDAALAVAHRPKTLAAKAREAALRELAEKLGVAARVHWIGETPSIHALLEASDVVALPSTSLFGKTDQPLVLLEAMSLGRPVVVAEGSAAEELSVGGGALSTPPLVDAVADSLGRLLGNAEERASLGRRARAVVFERYRAEVAARAYEALYDEVLGISSGG